MTEPIPSKRSARNIDILRRYIAGETLKTLAVEYKLTTRTIASAIRAAETDITASAVVEVSEQKKLESARLEVLFREAMHAWQASKLDKTKRRARTKKGRSEPGSLLEIKSETAELTTEGRDGNPRFLEVARQLASDIRRLWGLDATVEWTPDDLQRRAILSTLERQAAIADEQRRKTAGDALAALCPGSNRIAGNVRGNGNRIAN